MFNSLMTAILALSSQNAANESTTYTEAKQDNIGSVNKQETLRKIWAGIDGEIDQESKDWIAENAQEENLLMQPTGPVSANWPNVGVDLESIISKMPGGLENNVLISGEGGMYFFGGNFDDLSEEEWQLLYSGSRRSKLDGFQRGSFYSLTDIHLIYSGRISRKNGNAYCWDYSWPAKEVSKLYRRQDAPFDPSNPADVSTEETIMSFARRGLSTGTPALCEAFFEAENGQFSSIIFTPTGRPLEKWINPHKRYKIVPKVELRRLTTDFRKWPG